MNIYTTITFVFLQVFLMILTLSVQVLKILSNIEQDQEKHKLAPRMSVFDRLNRSKPRILTLDHIRSQDQTSVFKWLKKPTPQSFVFKRLSKCNKQSNMASSPP